MNRIDEKVSFVRCLDNGGYEVSLQLRGVYRCQPDPGAEARGLLRVIDETGDDYLYPQELFEPASRPDTGRIPRRRRN